MIKYVITVSKIFPTTHSRKGQDTNFVQGIASGEKLHTIRGNYEFWEKRFEKINQGLACLSIRTWTGKPYKSEQKEEFMLTNTDGIELQSFVMGDLFDFVGGTPVSRHDIAKNDHLSLPDFQEWFKKADFTKPMAMIHFTAFRY